MPPHRSGGTVDPGWEHGCAQDNNKKKVKCNYCGKVVSGGIFRFKQHLARISGQVTYCNNAPEEVCLKMKEILEGCQSIKKQRQISEEEEQATLPWHSNEDYEIEESPVVSKQKLRQVIANDKSTVMHKTPLRSLGYTDPGWEHGVAQEEGKKKVKCNYCQKVVSGGINRFKQHLARIPGEVAPCKNAPEQVYLDMKENMKWHRTGRKNLRPDTKETASFYMHSDNDYVPEEEQDEDLVDYGSPTKLLAYEKSLERDTNRRVRRRPADNEAQPKRSKLDTISHKMLTNNTPVSQPSANVIKVKLGSSIRNSKEVTSAICKFFYHAGIPTNAASSPYFQKMLDSVGQYGQGLKIPSSEHIAGQFLEDEIAEIKKYSVDIKGHFTSFGCTIMADSWKDSQGRTLINFFVSCPRGRYFVSSVDSTDIVEDAENLFKLLDGVVEEIGEEHVVQVITDNTATYKLAGKMLEEKRKSLFWTPCAASCIDQMLEDFVKIKWVGECMNNGQKVTKFIYNRPWLLNLMKKEFTRGRELLSSAHTRITSGFANLQRLLEHRNDIKRMFQSDKWVSSRFSKLDEGKGVENIVLNPTFWKKMQFVKKSVEPILQVLQKLDTEERLPMASLYNDLYKAKHTIKSIHGDDIQKYGPYWGVIENHWNPFHHPLYMAAYFLNPSCRYRPDFDNHPEQSEIIRGLNECIFRLEPDPSRRVSASKQIIEFTAAKADFGMELAVSLRTEQDPATWWEHHGISCLDLRRIAMRILGQTCSAFGCEHHWSIYDRIRSKTHNLVANKRLNDLIYVHYNLRLKERHTKRTVNNSTSLDTMLLENLLGDWTVESERPTLQENKEILLDETEQGETDENEANLDVHSGSMIESLEVQPVVEVTAKVEDEDLNLLDDLTD
ncbi:hypothetical protein C5167_030855 [Papaver somniferum]|uniref:uncharacterized protein LOC113334769 n=1 Tax=Papaver somniferum TaxID=3469 RepID=UPI000E705F67|nr:uncharacterized protein LOC113334769 [Papaver somniferum]RZC89167.1 hypothetical protein C5167_030855 [Papaver somniferum]